MGWVREGGEGRGEKGGREDGKSCHGPDQVGEEIHANGRHIRALEQSSQRR